MTEYRYAGTYGDGLSARAVKSQLGKGAPMIEIEVHDADRNVWIPTTDLPAVVAGILAQAGLATGRDVADPLTQLHADVDAIAGPSSVPADEPAPGTAAIAAHAPLLYALAAAYLGDDTPIWSELRRVQGERDTARFNNDALKAGTEAYRTERDQARAELDKANERAATFHAAWNSARGRAWNARSERDQARAEVEQLREEVARLRKAAVTAAREHVAELVATRDALHHDAHAALDRADKAEAETEQLRAELAPVREAELRARERDHQDDRFADGP